MGDPARVAGPMSVNEFLTWDSGDDFIWELIDGYPRLKFPPNPEFHGQAAPSDDHALIIMNIGSAIQTAPRAAGHPCHVYPVGGQTISRRHARHRIPDLLVKCGPRGSADEKPLLVVEVVSPSNTRSELAEREADYRSVPSLQEILVVEQDRPAVIWLRRTGELWRSETVERLDAPLALTSLEIPLTMTEIYRDIFPLT